MNREIKFRAFDLDLKEMLLVSQLWIDPKSHHWGDGILDQRNDFHKLQDIILMQYTGLKDSSDKEIWEGDIVKNYNSFYDPSHPFYDPTYGDAPCDIWKVEWNNEFFWVFKLLEASEEIECMHEFEKNDIEIIGNIYENPELLIEEK